MTVQIALQGLGDANSEDAAACMQPANTAAWNSSHEDDSTASAPLMPPKRTRALQLKDKRRSRLQASLVELMSALSTLSFTQPLQLLMLVGPSSSRPLELFQIDIPPVSYFDCANSVPAAPAHAMHGIANVETTQVAQLTGSLQARALRQLIQVTQKMPDTTASSTSKLRFVVKAADQLPSAHFEYSPGLAFNMRKTCKCTMALYTARHIAMLAAEHPKAELEKPSSRERCSGNSAGSDIVDDVPSEWYVSHAKVRGLHA